MINNENRNINSYEDYIEALQHFESQTKELQNQIDNQAIHIQHLEHQLNEFRNSFWWKFTKPMRIVTGVIKKAVKAIPGVRVIVFLLNPKYISKGVKLIKTKGFRAFIKTAFNILKGKPPNDGVTGNMPIDVVGAGIYASQQEETETLDIQNIINEFKIKPVFILIFSLYEITDKVNYITQSLSKQIYDNWEVIIFDYTNKLKDINKITADIISNPVRIVNVKKGIDIKKIYNEVIDANDTGYIFFADQFDVLPKDTLFWFAAEINKYPNADLLYCDECKIDNNGSTYDYLCKPDWSPSLLLSKMYIGRLAVYNSLMIKRAGGFDAEISDAFEYDLALRISNCTCNIRHIERILYFRRCSDTKQKSGKSKNKSAYNDENACIAIKKWYNSNNMSADVTIDNYIIDSRPSLPDNLTVSIIIPSDNTANMIKCINDIENSTSYNNYEYIIVTNSKAAQLISDEFSALENLRFYHYDNSGPFNFSDKCNKGASIAAGEALLFYNDDAVPATEQWLERLLEVSILPGVGAVGPIMLWGNNLIQSAGLITGTQSMVDNAFASGYNYNSTPSHLYDFHLLRDVSLLSGACLLINKNAFELINGFDSVYFANAFSDMDICFRLLEANCRCVCTPYSAVIHDTQNTWRNKNKPYKSFPELLYKWGHRLERDLYFTDSMKDLYYQPYPFPFAKFHIPSKPCAKHPESRSVLLVAHSLHLVGAPIVMLYMIQSIIENGDWPVLLCSCDGPLRQNFLDLGVTVIIDAAFQYDYPVFEYFARNFDIVIVNTLGCSKAITQLNDSLPPVLWWIHECPLTLKTYKHQIPESIAGNIHPYAGSAYSARTLTAAGLPYKYEVLVYGIPDIAVNVNLQEPSDKMIFLIVGTIYHRKGQDILLKAIDCLDDAAFANSCFIFIGSAPADTSVLDKVKEACMKHENILHFSSMPNPELVKWYQKADCLLLPSRDDPLPVVSIDSMMFSKPVVCSDRTGTADYISSYENGIVYPYDDYKALAKHITYAVENRSEIKNMGIKARRDIFEKHFTMTVFKNNIKNIIDELVIQDEQLGAVI